MKMHALHPTREGVRIGARERGPLRSFVIVMPCVCLSQVSVHALGRCDNNMPWPTENSTTSQLERPKTQRADKVMVMRR